MRFIKCGLYNIFNGIHSLGKNHINIRFSWLSTPSKWKWFANFVRIKKPAIYSLSCELIEFSSILQHFIRGNAGFISTWPHLNYDDYTKYEIVPGLISKSKRTFICITSVFNQFTIFSNADFPKSAVFELVMHIISFVRRHLLCLSNDPESFHYIFTQKCVWTFDFILHHYFANGFRYVSLIWN